MSGLSTPEDQNLRNDSQEANFGQNKTDITKPGNFASILEGVEGLDSSTIDAITQASTSSVNKERLKSEATQLVNEQ